MNYYNYFTEIEDTFVRRRGKHLLLSPIDWAMIEGWQERGVPLHIVLRAVESVFDNFDKKPGPRTIKSLLFCREEVEARYAEWQTAQIGRHSEPAEAKTENGFSVEKIEAHLAKSMDDLAKVNAESLREDLDRTITRLTELSIGLTNDFEAVDKSLSDIENFLDTALLSNHDKQHLKVLEKEVATQLKGYKADMAKEAYEQTFRLMLLKRLREELGIPRLGLFYL